MSKFPQHDRLAEVQQESQTIADFVDWLGSVKQIWLAVHDDGNSRGYLWPVSCSLEHLLAEFFGIDRGLLEREKRHMLEVQRALNEKYPPPPSPNPQEANQ